MRKKPSNYGACEGFANAEPSYNFEGVVVMNDKEKITKKELLERIEKLEESNKTKDNQIKTLFEVVGHLLVNELNSNYGVLSGSPGLYFGHQVFNKCSEE